MVEEIKALSEQQAHQGQSQAKKDFLDYYVGNHQSSSEGDSEDTEFQIKDNRELSMPMPKKVCQYFDQ